MTSPSVESVSLTERRGISYGRCFVILSVGDGSVENEEVLIKTRRPSESDSLR